MASITLGNSVPLMPTALAIASPRPPPNLRRCAIAPATKSTNTSPSLGSSSLRRARWVSVRTNASGLQYNARYQEGHKVRSILTIFPLRQAVEFLFSHQPYAAFHMICVRELIKQRRFFNAVGLA